MAGEEVGEQLGVVAREVDALRVDVADHEQPDSGSHLAYRNENTGAGPRSTSASSPRSRSTGITPSPNQ